MLGDREFKYELDFNDSKYSFNLSYTEDTINIKGRDENDIKENYEGSFAPSDLAKINNIFNALETSKRCYEYLLKRINNKGCKVARESNKLIVIFIVKDIITDNEIEIKLPLNPKALDTNTKIDNFSIVLKELKKEISLLKNQIDDLTNLKKENAELGGEVTTLKKEKEELKTELLNLKNEFKTFKDNMNNNIDGRLNLLIEKENNKEIEMEKEIFCDVNNSYILNTREEKLFFQNLIKCKNLSLLYRATQHGADHQNFKKFCGNKYPILTIFKNGISRKFGGYFKRGCSFSSSSYTFVDNDHFLFSIDLKKIYKIKNNIQQNYNSYPYFNYLLGVSNSDNFFEPGSCHEGNLKEKYDVDKDYKECEITGGKGISCKEIEVYFIEN